MESVRMVLMLIRSMSFSNGKAGERVAALISYPFALSRLLRPSPPGDLRPVDEMLVRVGPAGNLLITELIFGVAPDPLQSGNSVNGVDGQAESIDLVVDRQLHRGVDIAFFLITTYVHSLVLPAVGQAVNQIRITVEVENDWLVHGEQRIEIRIR